MLSLLWRLLIGRFGCDHEWEIIREIDVLDRSEWGGPIMKTGTKFHLQCMNCGTVKAKTL